LRLRRFLFEFLRSYQIMRLVRHVATPAA
jgi:hypothetical protein